MSATVGVFILSFMSWMSLFMINTIVLGGLIPISIMMIMLFAPIMAGVYTYYKPKYAAQSKLIDSSGEMILAILYMVVYMRSSPNLEGAVRFAALNLEGPISDDLKGVLWDLEVGKYNKIDQALENYTRRWKDYNDDFLESLNLLRSAMNQPDPQRRESMLQDAIDNILDGTQEKMKHYAQNLETPVMILNAMGAMLPVLGMIMLPLISVFMGDAITPMHLFMLFNVLLPAFLYWFMKRVLSSRPPTVATKPVDDSILPERGKYTINMMNKRFRVPVWPIGVAVFMIFSFYGFVGYLSTMGAGDGLLLMYPAGEINTAVIPSIYLQEGGTLAPLPMLMRSVSIIFGLGVGIGTVKTLGNLERKKAEDRLSNIEDQFPSALFELGNKISGGTPVELALEDAAEATSELEISDLFSKASENVTEMGMTFEQAVMDKQYGALRQFPSQMIRTVMKATIESSKKGTDMASTAMLTISRYLKNIHKTQEQLNDLMEDTTTTIQMLAYLLAPVVSGVAVGMSQTIITAMTTLSQSITESQVGGGQAAAGGLGGVISGFDSAIPPELLQFVVGLYLIQLLFILGSFFTKIKKGNDPTYRALFTGKIMISGMFFYAMTLIIVGMLFGGMVGSVSQVAA
jgi:Flp pilus assembly protein TadB